MLPLIGSKVVRPNDGTDGLGIGKKRMVSCNGEYRGSNFASIRKYANLPAVTEAKRKCLITNVGEPEMTSVTDPTDRELTRQRKDIDWAEVERLLITYNLGLQVQLR